MRSLSVMNPLAAVDTAQLEAAMKLASLDNLKGYNPGHHAVVKQPGFMREKPAQNELRGYEVVREPALWKGELFVQKGLWDCQADHCSRHIFQS